MAVEDYTEAYRKVRAKLKREAPPICGLCGEWIDLSLHYHDPMAWEADHIVSLVDGGDREDILNLQPSHRVCNQRKQGNSYKSTEHKGSRRV